MGQMWWKVLLIGGVACGCGSKDDDDDDDDRDSGAEAELQTDDVPMPDYIPVDGQRSWEYIQDDVFSMLRIEKPSGTTTVDGVDVSTMYVFDVDLDTDEQTLRFSVNLTSDPDSGVAVHGWSDAGGAETSFDPPLRISGRVMSPGVALETTSGDVVWTSTFVALEDCENYWVSDVWECAHLRLDDGGAGLPFAGDWWVAEMWGLSWFQSSSDAAPWVLGKAVWAPDE